ncbi:MAG: FAD-dependent oxidoreductase, partial [Chloroflexi bacterium]|nr:FAD-dependent oxidoreductase [Chloroflexota bacterium]
MATFKHLFTPIQVGHVTIRNRIVSTPHATRFGSDGYITERYIRYHAEKAKGGAGLVQCFGSMGVHPTAPVADWNGIKNFDDSSLPTFTAFAAGVHKHGAHVMAQITHRGRRGSSVASGIPLQAPSDIPERHHNEIPHEIEKEMIAEIVRAYAAAALRLKRAGFDGADLAGFARHLIDQFWVPSVNRRTDEYGGSFENRMRFGVEVVQAIRAAVGRDFILGMRVTGDELVENGLGLEEMVEIVRYYNDLRLLDYFTVTGSTGETVRHTAMLMPFANAPHAVYAPFAARIREVVDVPIIYVGRVVDPLHADRLIDEGVCDLVAMTRALIADPHMPRKAMEGRLDDIRACLGMQDGCLGGGLVSCSQNPVTGREEELAEIVPAAVRKKVVVVGGGPAGLEAARVAALRGHVVVLYEKGPELGGQVLVAGRAPLRPAYDDSVRWLARQVAKTGVTVHLGTEATVETVLAERPDAVVIATGAAPWVPELPGVELPGVCTVSDILQGSTSAGRRCVVVDNTGTVQAGLAADFLAKQGHEGREVIAVTPYHMLCEGMGASTKEPLYAELYAGNVVVTPDTDLKAIEAVDGT